jgi:hypothetical protein
MRRGLFLVLILVTSLVWPGTALAVPPFVGAVSQQDRHPSASFSVPRADFATIYLATKPDRATDGSFLQENIKTADLLTDSEIQSGRWSDENQIDPGNYWVMLWASPDFNACYISAPGPATFDPACADGFSNVLTLVVPKPAVRYAARVTTYRYLPEVSLRLIARPLGERVPYRVCYRMKNGAARCVSGALDGYDWNSSADDTLSVSTRNLPRITTFTWYVSGRKVVSKRVRVR